MSSRPNTESKLISALVNTEDVAAAASYGVHPEMFQSHQAEYRWVTEYPKIYDSQPSADSLTEKFPEFPYSSAYSDVGFICDQVKDNYIQRSMVIAIQGAGLALKNGDIAEAHEYLTKISYPTNTLGMRLRNVLFDEAFLDSYEEPVDTIPMPWPTLQRVTGGIRPGDLWQVAARLGQGKSWMLARIVIDALLAGKRVCMFSLEMPERQVLTRIHALLGIRMGVDVTHHELHHRTYDPIAYRRLVRQIRADVPGELYIVDNSRGMVTTSHVAERTKDVDLATIDYAGLLGSPTGTRATTDWRDMAVISNVLKETATMNNVPIISAAQINREGDTTGWKPPKVKNLAQSDALGQDADVVLTMKQRSKTVAVYSVEKNRHGESADLFHTRFLPNIGNFDEIGFEQAKDLVQADQDREDDQ